MMIQEGLQQILAEGLERGLYPSAAAAIGVGSKLLAMDVCGRVSLPDGDPANLETRYDMASLTKILATTMIALQAIERGELSLSSVLGDFFDAPPDKAGITVFQLMTHTGRMPSHFLIEEVNPDPKAGLKVLLERELEPIAYGVPCYACAGFIFLGWILEKLYGRRLDELARERVFGPLGMTSTGYLPVGGNIAATEVDPITGVAWQGVTHDENARFLGNIMGNAGLFSNIKDTARFTQMLSLGGEGIIKPETLKMAIQNYTPCRDMHRGLGFHLAGGSSDNFIGSVFPSCSFGHTGFTGTSIVVDPTTGIYACLLTNRIHPSRDNDPFLAFRPIFHDFIYPLALNEIKNETAK